MLNSLALRLLPALALACGASSCLNIPRASAEDEALAKSFETRPDMCGLYVYREGTTGGALELELVLDGHPFGRTGGGDFLFAWVDPGEHTLESRGDSDMQLAFRAKAASMVFVRQEGELGYWTFASKLTLVGEAEGQGAVRARTRVVPDG